MTTYTGPELCALTATEAVARLKSKEISPKELLQAAFERIEAVDGAVNALPTRCEERAFAASEARDYGDSILAGLPVSIKDLSEVEGVRTTYGSLGFADFVPDESDAIVTQIEGQGGIVHAKSNTPEMGAGGNTFNAVFGKTRNPWDTRRSAGGSSGGAAVSLATGSSWLAQGSDLAGSLRTPAAYCGVVGFRPSPGAICASDADSHFERDALYGPMARTVADCALFLDAMSGYDPSFAISQHPPTVPYREAVQKEITPRIAFAVDLGGFGRNEPALSDHLTAAMHKLERNGAVVEESCPELSALDRTYRVLRAMVWASGPGRLDPEVQKHYKATLSGNIDFVNQLSLDDVLDAQLHRSRIFHSTAQHLKDFDVLACPVVGVMPTMVEEEYPQSINGVPVSDYIEWLRYSFLSTTTGLPSVSVPVGFLEGMPVGLQLIGQPRGEAALLQAAQFVENVMGGPNGPIDPIVRHENH